MHLAPRVLLEIFILSDHALLSTLRYCSFNINYVMLCITSNEHTPNPHSIPNTKTLSEHLCWYYSCAQQLTKPDLYSCYALSAYLRSTTNLLYRNSTLQKDAANRNNNNHVKRSTKTKITRIFWRIPTLKKISLKIIAVLVCIRYFLFGNHHSAQYCACQTYLNMIHRRTNT